MDFDELRNFRYSRPNLQDWTLDENLPQYPSQKMQLEAHASLGMLELLPLELLHETLLQLDIRSLMNLRYVNRRAVDIVDSQPAYRTIAKFAPRAVRAILGVQTGAWITCELLYEKLFALDCDECGDFAGFLYVLTCRRICFLCFSEKEEYFPLGAALIQRRYGLKKSQMEKVPHLKSLPGTYSSWGTKLSKSTLLYDYRSIIQAAILHHGSRDAVLQYTTNVLKRLEMNAKTRREKVPREGSDPSPARMPAGLFPYDRKSSNPRRFVAVISLPCLVSAAGSMTEELGFHCNGCSNSNERPFHWRRKYTAMSFERHLQECGRINGERHESR